MDVKKAVRAAGLVLSLGILLTLVIRVAPEQIQAATDPQLVTVSRVASTGIDVPISSDGSWAEATITIDDVPEGALVKGVSLKYEVGGGLEAAGLDIELTAPGSETARALSADSSSEPSGLRARVQSISDVQTFNGQPINGDWTLAVRQDAGGQEGYLDSFSISVDFETDAPMPQEKGDATGKPVLFRLPADHPAAPADDDDGKSVSAPEALRVSSPDSWQLIEAEDFEGRFPSGLWDVPYGGWDDRSCSGRHTNGTWAAWNADLYASSCSDTYDNNRYDWMIYGPFDLSNAVDAEVEFDMWREIEPNYDRVAFGVSSDGTNFSSISWDGFHPWEHHTVGFSDFVGDSSVWAAFIFESDSGVTYEGAWIDQVELRKDVYNAPPAPPSNLNASCNASQSGINLSWSDNSNDEQGFEIYRNGSYLTSVGANTTSYTDYSISCDVNYCYEVVAYNSNGNSNPSNTDCATCPCGGVTTIVCEDFEGTFPSGLWDVPYGGWDDRSCSGRHPNGTWAAWNADLYSSSCSDTYDNSRYDWMIYGPFDLSDATTAWAEFDLWREIEQNHDRVAFGVSSDGTNFSSISWDGFHPWEHHTVGFSDFVGDSSVWAAFIFESDSSVTYEGAWVDQVCLYKQVRTCPTPTAPSGLNASCNASGTAINLSWNDNSTNESHFYIYRDGSYLTSVGANTTSYSDGAIAPNVSYCYYVVAHNSCGNSNASNTDCATCGGPCPTTVRIDPDPASVSGTGTVCVYVDNVTNLGGFEFDLDYNPSCVHVLDIVLGAFPGSTGRSWSPTGPTINNSTGTATFGGFSFGSQPGATGSGCMAEITLDCQGTVCTSALDLQNVDLLDTVPNPLCATVQDGQVTCSACPWPPDFDGDGDVDVADIMHCASRWGCQCGDGCYELCCDFDNDCDIDVADIMQVAAQWGWTGP
jgi:hypothetical protein